MSPIEQIADGIYRGDWQTVCEGYEKLTGEWIAPPSTENRDTQDVLEQLKKIISEALKPKMAKKKKVIKKKATKKKVCSSKKVEKKSITDEEDSSIELDDSKRTIVQKDIGQTQLITNNPCPEEVESNKKKSEAANGGRIRVERPAVSSHQVECNECEKMFDSDRPSGQIGQKCPTCLRKKKNRSA